MNIMNLNKAMGKVLHLGQGNPKHKYSLGEEWTKDSPVENGLGILVDEKQNMSQQPRKPAVPWAESKTV